MELDDSNRALAITGGEGCKVLSNPGLAGAGGASENDLWAGAQQGLYEGFESFLGPQGLFRQPVQCELPRRSWRMRRLLHRAGGEQGV